MARVITEYASWILFAWILANQAGVPVPVVPALLGAGALAGSGRLRIAVILAVGVGATLVADLGWYSLGRWRGARALDVLGRISPQAGRYVRCAEHVLLGHAGTCQFSARFLPELSPIVAGLAGAARLSLPRFVAYGAMSALAWAGAWVTLGYLLNRTAPIAAYLGIPLLGFGVAALLLYLPIRRAHRHRILQTLRAARISPDELKARLDTGDTTIIFDVRAADEVAAVPYALPGAVWIPPDELARRSRGFPHGALVVLYDGGSRAARRTRATLYASIALHLCHSGIRKVRPLAGGLHAWQLRGYPVQPLGARLIASEVSSGASPRVARTLLCLLVIVSAGLSAGCRGSSTASGAPPPPAVKVEPVLEKDVPIYGEWVGTTVGYVTAQISARVPGYLVNQTYKEGTRVKAGDLLFEIDPRPYQIAAEQARAQLDQAESQLEQAKAQVAQAEADVARAEANQKKTELDVARDTPLAERGSISQQEMDNAVQANLANLASLKAAWASLANARAGVPRTRADIAQARAVLDNAQLNHSWAKVFSPVTGIAGIKNANLGDLISASTVLTTVSQVDPIYVQFPVSEQEYLRLRQRGPLAGGDRERQYDLELTLADGATYPNRGTVAILDRAVGATTGTISIRGVFPNPGDLLRPGQYAKVRAVIDMKKSALLIPQRAVLDQQGVHQVAVVGPDDTVDLRTVQVEERVGPLWIVGQGLKPGERVIVEGIDRVKAGQKVKPTPAQPERSS
jgi:membrane fusion protein, multidrug efflux system